MIEVGARMKTHFSNVEKIDGYFSGTLEINANNGDNFILDFVTILIPVK